MAAWPLGFVSLILLFASLYSRISINIAMFEHCRLRRILLVALVAWAVLVPETGARAGEADDHFAVAAGHYDRQEWQLAVDEFRAFVAKYPNDRRAERVRLLPRRGVAPVGQVRRSRPAVSSVHQPRPDGRRGPRPRCSARAKPPIWPGSSTPRNAELTRFLEKYPGDPLNAFALPYLGDIAMSGGDVAAAAAYYRNGLKQFPNGRLQDDCRFGLAATLQKQNQSEEAERLYAAVAGKPDSPLGRRRPVPSRRLAIRHGKIRQGDRRVFRPSRVDWPKALGGPMHGLHCGLALLKLNQPDEAIKQFDAVLAMPSIDDEVIQQAFRARSRRRCR